MGRTPLVRLKSMGHIIAKLEFFNPLGSVKDRIGVAMIEAAEQEGKIGPQTVIVEPTSGNTGIALAWVCAAKGYPLVIVMPDSKGRERIALLETFGVEVVLTPAHLGMQAQLTRP